MAGVSGTPRMRFRLIAIAVGAVLVMAPALAAGAPAAGASTTTAAVATATSCTNTSFVGFGQPATAGTIGAAGQVDCYQVFAKARQSMRVRVVGTGGALVPSAEVDGPNGAVICGPATADDQTCTPTVKGLQTIAIQDSSGTNTGGYTVAVQTFKKPLNCGTLSFGSPPTTGTISAGDIACFTFRAPAGAQLLTRAVATSGSLVPMLQEINANGRTLGGPDAMLEQHCRLLSGGNETFFVEDSAGPNTGSFSIYAQLTRTVTCSNIKFGKAVQSAITSAGQTDCYKFAGVQNHHIRITVAATSGTLDTFTEVVKPTGTVLCSTSTVPEQSCRILAAGANTIFVSDNAGTNTGNYTIYVQDLNAPLGCTQIEYTTHNHTTPGSISFPGTETCYTFAGTAGTGAHLKVTSTGGSWTPEFNIYTPNGVDFPPEYCDLGATDERCVLGTTDTYLILVRDAAAMNTGTYNYTLGERTFS